jgi:hypothetical protein
MERMIQLLDVFDDLIAVVRWRLHWFPAGSARRFHP